MAYNSDNLQKQLEDLQRQYQQLQGYQTQPAQQNFAQPVQPSLPIIPHQVQYVSGILGAKKYQQERLTPNSSEVIMDKDENIFYLVSKDANGISSSKIPSARFELIEEPEEEPLLLTKKEFESFKEEIREMLSHREPDRIQPVSRPQSKKEEVK